MMQKNRTSTITPTMSSSSSSLKMTDSMKSLTIKKKMPTVIVFDLETTGLRKDYDRIVEIACVDLSDVSNNDSSGEEIRNFQTLVNPGRFAIPPLVQQLTGITNAMVSAPEVPSFQIASERFEAFIESAKLRNKDNNDYSGEVLLAAHNARQFDSSFLQREYWRLGKEMPPDWRFLDTLPLSRNVLKDSETKKDTKFTLDALSKHYGISIKEGEMMHRALTDVKCLSRILQQLIIDNEKSNSKFSADKVALLESCSFSVGDTGGNSLKRSTTAAANNIASTSAAQPYWFAGGTTRTSTGGIADPADPWGNLRAMNSTDDFDDNLNGNDDDDTIMMTFGETRKQYKEESDEAKTRNRLKRPFWAQSDPINGFAPPTLDFEKLQRPILMSDSEKELLRYNKDVWKETPIAEAFGEGSKYFDKLDAEHAAGKLDDDELKALKNENMKTLKTLQENNKPDKDRKDKDKEKEKEKDKKDKVETVEAILRVCPRKYQEYSRMSNDVRPGTSVSLRGKIVGVQIAPYSKSRSKQPNVITLETIDDDGDNDESNNKNTNDSSIGWEKSTKRKFKVKIWDYITKDQKMSLTRDAIVKVRGTLGNFIGSEFSIESAKIITDKSEINKPVGNAGEVVATYQKKGLMTNEEWHKAIPRALEFFNEKLDKLEVDPLEISLGEENELLKELQLISHKDAFNAIHEPATVEDVARARERLAFEELFIRQVHLMSERKKFQTLASNKEGISIVSTHLCDQLRKELSFSLTGSQDRALEEILNDMAGPAPMLRLLQGDVGCGKTVVAALALLAAVGAGHQGAFMAPTEVLANQHYKTISDLLREMGPDAPKCEIITGSTKQKDLKVIYEKIESGEISIVIGTHSIYNADLKYKSLGLAVVDEQHRFGVDQRAKLSSKGNEIGTPCHLLTMTATPIPRTLAMTKYGEMGLSVIEEKPAGRFPILTKILDPPEHETAFEAIEEETRRGGQAYYVLRYVSEKETDKNQTKGAEEEFERIKKRLPNVRFGLLHGKLSSEDKQNALDLFVKGETQCLVATSVIEVGVDVPNASLIIIDANVGGGSGGFGLAALHQLRGRVGRGARQSRCYLLNAPNVDEERDDQSRERLAVLEKTNDGFRVAESDLQLRGAGDFYGTNQSGISDLFHASLATDLYLLESARKAAAELVATSDEIEVEGKDGQKEKGVRLPAFIEIALEAIKEKISVPSASETK